MERTFKRIAEELRLPQESRERIRSQLASCPKRSEDITMKRPAIRSRALLLAAAVAVMAALTLTAAAAVVQLFRNDTIVSSMENIPMPSGEDGAPGAVAVTSPNGNLPFTLEETAESSRFKSEDWDKGERINGGVELDYFQWDSAEVLSSDPALRSRRVSRGDGAEKMEYTAEDPKALLDTLTGRVTFDLTWMEEQYDHVPDADLSYVVSDAKGRYVSEYFEALYAKEDGSGYVTIAMENRAKEVDRAQGYIVDGDYETAYYYTSADGYEFLIKMDRGWVWVQCYTPRAGISLVGAYLTAEEVEDILDHLSLAIDG